MEEFDAGAMEKIGQILERCCTHAQLSSLFKQCKFDPEPDENIGLSKAKRINAILAHEQSKVHSPICILRFIKECLSLSRFVDKKEELEEARNELNRLLVLYGLEYGKDCEFRQIKTATTIDEIDARVNSLLSKLRDRNVHYEVLKYCTRELLQEDYFHSILEASKGICQRVRDLSGLTEDGTKLMQRAFASSNPVLVFNSLQTESELSEHKGLSSLFQGCCQFFRNPRAHAPRILWREEQNVVEALTFISMLHRILDNCIKTPRPAV